MENLRFESDLVEPKKIKVGNYIGIGTGDDMKTAEVLEISSAKCGKHGSAKVIVLSKILVDNSNHRETYNGNDMVVIRKSQKKAFKVIDASGESVTYCDENTGMYPTIDLSGKMDKEEIKKIIQTIEEGSAESYDLQMRILPDFYKFDSIKPSS